MPFFHVQPMLQSTSLPRVALCSQAMRNSCAYVSARTSRSRQSTSLLPVFRNVCTRINLQYVSVNRGSKSSLRLRSQAHTIGDRSNRPVYWHMQRDIHKHTHTHAPTFVRAEGHLTANGSCIYTQRQAITQSANLLRTDRYAQHTRSVESSIRTRSYIEARTLAIIRGKPRRTRIRKRKTSKHQIDKDRLSQALAETYAQSYAKAKMHTYAHSQSHARTYRHVGVPEERGMLSVCVAGLIRANKRYDAAVRYSALYGQRARLSTSVYSHAANNARVHNSQPIAQARAHTHSPMHDAHVHAHALSSYADESDLQTHAHAYTSDNSVDTIRVAAVGTQSGSEGQNGAWKDFLKVAGGTSASAPAEHSTEVARRLVRSQNARNRDSLVDVQDAMADRGAACEVTRQDASARSIQEAQAERMEAHTDEIPSEDRHSHQQRAQKVVGMRYSLRNEDKRVMREWDQVVRVAENVRYLDRRGVLNAEEGERMCVQLAKLLDISNVCTEEEVTAVSITNTLLSASNTQETEISQETMARLRSIDVFQLRTLSLAMGVYIEHPSMNPTKAARNRDPAVRRKVERNNVYAKQRVLCARLVSALRERALMLATLKPDVFAHAAMGLSRAAYANERYTDALVKLALVCVDQWETERVVDAHESGGGVQGSSVSHESAQSASMLYRGDDGVDIGNARATDSRLHRRIVDKRRGALQFFSQALHNEYNHLVDLDAEAEGQLEKAIRIRNKKIRIRESGMAQTQRTKTGGTAGEESGASIRGDSITPTSWKESDRDKTSAGMDANAEIAIDEQNIAAASDALQGVRARRLGMLSAHAKVLNVVLSNIWLVDVEPTRMRSKRNLNILGRMSKRVDISYSPDELEADASKYARAFDQGEAVRGVRRGQDESGPLNEQVYVAKMDVPSLTALAKICTQCKELYTHALGEVNSYVEVDGRLPGGNWHARAYEMNRASTLNGKDGGPVKRKDSVHTHSSSSASPSPGGEAVGMEKYLSELEVLAERATKVASGVAERNLDLMMMRM
ncbi:hypothetical protein SARC_02772 [Sphaeroforma arctica JP610]|uniref:Uncharacterized protein n=1 Tax=Sphaeroforma arctica JP610 TaxID=667725 RepID=A0A0L0G7K4_9EUKA|nr:hypothetical protein SARC_02772 [Sphaeroforma arctica JP610]KNC85017.1 hypothetical protein SARC_02772 [Sphaeroforma arctica JP610]|eukprot:XP_014158919.1 hypothetical protein SARC_02772 [Sphaeroforma arctica JP610]